VHVLVLSQAALETSVLQYIGSYDSACACHAANLLLRSLAILQLAAAASQVRIISAPPQQYRPGSSIAQQVAPVL